MLLINGVNTVFIIYLLKITTSLITTILDQNGCDRMADLCDATIIFGMELTSRNAILHEVSKRARWVSLWYARAVLKYCQNKYGESFRLFFPPPLHYLIH